jgi:hypothetical protein
MDTLSRRRQRKEEVRARAASPDSMYKYCRVLGCGKPARAGTPDGLDRVYCRSHAERFRRHGSAYKVSYPAKALNPYRRAALAWLQGNAEDFWVQNAVSRVKGLYSRAGQHEEAFRLRGKNPVERAKAHWARLRKADIDPSLIIAAWLAVEMVIADDRQPVQTKEFKRVQAAKVVHRMASGTHRRWVQEIADRHNPGQRKPWVTELHVYPRSRGRVLRRIGSDLEEAAELLVDHRLCDVRMFKQAEDERGAFTDRPYPKTISGRRRKKKNSSPY